MQTTMTPWQRVDSAPVPMHGPADIRTRDVAEAALAAAMLDIYGWEAVRDAGPREVANDLIRVYPGLQDWLGMAWPIRDLASAAWVLAMRANNEYEIEEVTNQ